MGTLTGNVKKCEKHPNELCWLWEWEPGTVCPACGATQGFLHQPASGGPTQRAGDSAIASESEGSGLIEQLFGVSVRRNPPSA
jgi:hypothetical protein